MAARKTNFDRKRLALLAVGIAAAVLVLRITGPKNADPVGPPAAASPSPAAPSAKTDAALWARCQPLPENEPEDTSESHVYLKPYSAYGAWRSIIQTDSWQPEGGSGAATSYFVTCDARTGRHLKVTDLVPMATLMRAWRALKIVQSLEMYGEEARDQFQSARSLADVNAAAKSGAIHFLADRGDDGGESESSGNVELDAANFAVVGWEPRTGKLSLMLGLSDGHGELSGVALEVSLPALKPPEPTDAPSLARQPFENVDTRVTPTSGFLAIEA
jgi:hypothetical protein